ncbi:hypothetical protein M2404_003770 [Rheinheimera pacifica]|uniref:hypothetical protein n=1 Tax=Rheinheimera pacifica TaxID=173990 RepID=UPI002169B2C0|nr:hypothetical protein [Rheinheimera pacifica]MCS4309398.1 hypothetical protein [Rheinheimera pacifica]
MKKKALDKFIVLFGVLDLMLICKFFMNFISQEGSFTFGKVVNLFSISTEFGSSMQLITVVSLLLYLSIVISAPLLILKKKIGVILSLAQSPFRFTMIIQPTFFFLPIMLSFKDIGLFIIGAIVLLLEIAKVWLQISWLRVEKKSIGHQ